MYYKNYQPHKYSVLEIYYSKFFHLKICPSVTLSLNVEKNQHIQNGKPVSTIHTSDTHDLIKTVLVVRKISIKPTKSGFSVNGF